MRKKKVLIVDDSALMRQMLTDILGSAPDLDVVGAAPDPYVAREMIKQLNPDVITLDVEMPRMDGLEFLEKIMTLRPTPVVMISSLTKANAEVTVRALEAGAVDYVQKPTRVARDGYGDMEGEIIARVRTASRARVHPVAMPHVTIAETEGLARDRLIAIGASTGGVSAIAHILSELPANTPPVAIVQHMPREYTAGFARRLDSRSKLTVMEARDNLPLEPGLAVVAPGDTHLRIKQVGAQYRCVLSTEDKIQGHRPSVDALFSSVAEQLGAHAVGVILTGMGRDGAAGLLKILQAGGRTIGQDEATATVYGMCGAAFQIGAVEMQLPITEIARAICQITTSRCPVTASATQYRHV